LLDYLYEHPITTVRLVEKHLEVSYATANKVIHQFAERDLLRESTGYERNRRFAYDPYLTIFHAETDFTTDEPPAQTTESP